VLGYFIFLAMSLMQNLFKLQLTTRGSNSGSGCYNKPIIVCCYVSELPPFLSSFYRTTLKLLFVAILCIHNLSTIFLIPIE